MGATSNNPNTNLRYYKKFFDLGLKTDACNPSSQLLVDAYTANSTGPANVQAVSMATDGISNNPVSKY
ncbi:MAG: hypothetical protein EXS37_10480 [Opitutus sp.]|nr:hypothetical protein [Opitutus sp.]